MTQTLTPKQALELIKQHVKAEGSQQAFAARHGLSNSYVSDTLNGRRAPSAAILGAVGLEKATVYTRPDPASKKIEK